MNSALAARATGALREFNAAGVLAPADVHVAQRLAAIALEDDEQVMLAVAFAVRGPRLGHVTSTSRRSATPRPSTPRSRSIWRPCRGPRRRNGSSGWPPAGSWRWGRRAAPSGRCGSSARRSTSTATGARRWGRGGSARGGAGRSARGFGGRLEGSSSPAARARARRRWWRATSPACSSRPGPDPSLVALAAPTGKAAARLSEAVHEEAAARHPRAIRGPARARGLDAAPAARLAARQPQPLPPPPHEPAAVRRRDRRRDVDGVALADGAADRGGATRRAADPRRRPRAADVDRGRRGAGRHRGAASEGIVTLEHVHRFGGGIAAVADAIRRGDGDATVEALAGVEWIDRRRRRARRRRVACFRAVADAARDGGGRAAIEARRGGLPPPVRAPPRAHGVEGGRRASRAGSREAGLAADGGWYAGRAAARDRERLRARPLQRRHRRGDRGRRRPRGRRVRARRRARRVQPDRGSARSTPCTR